MHLLRCPAAARTAAALCAVGLLLPASGAGAQLTVTRVDFAPTVTAKLQEYGESEGAVGAELKGEVRDAQQHLLTTVSYRYFAPDITAASPARDPWADARVAIDGFAAKLAAAIRDLASTGAR